ncbi:hypothetical protein K438DRAFT_1877042 [Mycena galopus ATCC 62051]|nr:hypothetical protein K438DRAFT_1877042 [Mycena galopus ATCC 62051]
MLPACSASMQCSTRPFSAINLSTALYEYAASTATHWALCCNLQTLQDAVQSRQGHKVLASPRQAMFNIDPQPALSHRVDLKLADLLGAFFYLGSTPLPQIPSRHINQSQPKAKMNDATSEFLPSFLPQSLLIYSTVLHTAPHILIRHFTSHERDTSWVHIFSCHPTIEHTQHSHIDHSITPPAPNLDSISRLLCQRHQQ